MFIYNKHIITRVVHNMDISKLRQRVYRLDQRRRKLQGYLLKPRKMIRGSLYEIYRKCGNPNCKCARGEKHQGKYLSVKKKGKTKMTYVRRGDEKWVTTQANNYRRYQKWMADVRKINKEIFEILKKIRDSKVRDYK